MQIIEFVPLLSMVQEHISSRYAAALTDTSKLPALFKQLKVLFVNDKLLIFILCEFSEETSFVGNKILLICSKL